MRPVTRAVLAAALFAIGSRAGAHAYADVSFAGMDLSQQGSGTAFDVLYFGQPLASGTSFTETFAYTVTLHADGEAANRAWSFCLPLSGLDCGPAATGREQVDFEFGFQQAKEASPFTSYQFSGLPTGPMVVDTGTATFSGTFSVTESIASMGSFQSLDYLTLWGATWVDANDALPAIPEPAVVTLMLLGLGLLGAKSRRRGRASVDVPASSMRRSACCVLAASRRVQFAIQGSKVDDAIEIAGQAGA